MFLRPTGSQWRTPQLGKNIIVSSYRGVTSVQAWPKKRGPAKTLNEQNRQIIFTIYQGLIKRLHPRESYYERQAIQEHNRTHRGQRGSAAIRLRDWICQRLYGRGVVVDVPGLATFYPIAIKRDASNILDHCTDSPGQLLQRTGETWQSIAAPLPGQVLITGAPGQANYWKTLT